MAGKIDCVIVGAGAAGVAALAELDRVGVRTLCLEARDRIGGRIHTLHDPLSPVAIELGAEFVHGRPPEIFDVVQGHGLMAYAVAGSAVHVRTGRVQKGADGWEPVNRVMEHMRRAAKSGKDRSFADFLKSTRHAADAKQLAASYVEGFNAARKEIISIRSLKQDAEAADRINGDCSFRLVNGYDAVVLEMLSGVKDLPAKLKLHSVVETIEWNPRGVTVRFRSGLTGQIESLEGRRAIITVPLGVLQCGGMAFDPEPNEALEAARALQFGQVLRLVLRFEQAFWEEKEEFAKAGFLLSDQPFFPTWWTPAPIRAPAITGWSAGPHADALLGKTKDEIVRHALEDLSKITGCELGRLNRILAAAYLHDWHADPFARGAYSYVPVGAMDAREKLAKSIRETLYFAGEAVETEGHSATVHGAIASGRRAAREILERG